MSLIPPGLLCRPNSLHFRPSVSPDQVRRLLIGPHAPGSGGDSDREGTDAPEGKVGTEQAPAAQVEEGTGKELGEGCQP